MSRFAQRPFCPVDGIITLCWVKFWSQDGHSGVSTGWGGAVGVGDGLRDTNGAETQGSIQGQVFLPRMQG